MLHKANPHFVAKLSSFVAVSTETTTMQGLYIIRIPINTQYYFERNHWGSRWQVHPDPDIHYIIHRTYAY